MDLTNPLATEDLQFEGPDGRSHVLTLILGRPFETPGRALTWRCPFAYGVDGQITRESSGGTGPVTAILNASLTMAAYQERVLAEARHAPR
jgi:hypothetical protein